MPRPDFPKIFIDRWEAGFQEVLANIPGLGEGIIDRLREIFYAAFWLSDSLNVDGIAPEEIEKVCFIHGQRCFYEDDAWHVAIDILARFRRGELNELMTKAGNFPKIFTSADLGLPRPEERSNGKSNQE